MRKSILYVAIDVDDLAFHGAGYDEKTEKYYEFKCKPTVGGLLNRIERLEEKGFEIHLCYEATYIGYGLHRNLEANGIHCDIVAPSSIPEKRSKRVKTDRIDSRKLAEYYSKGLLTVINIPDKTDEEVRQLIRSRSFIVDQRRRLKQHILSSCRFNGIDYRRQTNTKGHHWTQKHLQWLNSQIIKQPEITRKMFERLLSQLIVLDEEVKNFDILIDEFSSMERYQKRSQALACIKGIDTLSAMTLLTEIGDIKRFPHPKNLVSYMGMDIVEYSSGGKEKKFGITKMGNRKIRTTLVEACQSITLGTSVGKLLRSRRKGVPIEYVKIAERCQNRLWKKKHRMSLCNKVSNKIKVACAREMAGFVWEMLVTVG
jgi:transposase